MNSRAGLTVERGLLSAIFGIAIGIAIVRPVNADSLILPKKAAPVELQTPLSWDGPYFGAFAGVGFGSGSWNTAPTVDFNASGALIGAIAGWNFQYSQAVIGVEGDIAWSSLRGGLTPCIANCEIQNSFLSTYRGRIGYSLGAWLPFATAGLALGDIRTDRNEFRAGWALGGGVEYAVSSWLTARVDYLHIDFRGFSCGSACGPGAPNGAQFSEHNFRVGFTIPFWPKPKPQPYPDPNDPGPRMSYKLK